jgi:hypothetical protein
MHTEALAKYAQAHQALTALETRYGTASLARVRTPLANALATVQALDWRLDWASEPRPQDCVLTAPGVDRDHAPACYPLGAWLHTGRGLGLVLWHYSDAWRKMLGGAARGLGVAALNNSAFAARHELGVRSLVEALGLMVGVETHYVNVSLTWMADPPDTPTRVFPPPGVPRQQDRWKLIMELLANPDPPVNPRGHDYSNRDLFETGTVGYTSKMVCDGWIQYMRTLFPMTDAATKQRDTLMQYWWLPALEDLCWAGFWGNATLYRSVSDKFYAPRPLGE